MVRMEPADFVAATCTCCYGHRVVEFSRVNIRPSQLFWAIYFCRSNVTTKEDDFTAGRGLVFTRTEKGFLGFVGAFAKVGRTGIPVTRADNCRVFPDCYQSR